MFDSTSTVAMSGPKKNKLHNRAHIKIATKMGNFVTGCHVFNTLESKTYISFMLPRS